MNPEDGSPAVGGPGGEEADGVDGQSAREAARDRRESLSPAERERVEATVSELLDLLGRAHTMAILREFAFAEGSLRFSEVEDALAVPPNTLSRRLEELGAAGLLERQSHEEVPPRVEYRPTERARALFPAFGHLHRWAVEHDLDTSDGTVAGGTE
jgi:DNA-binding HxlR family transcriptional regulator